ncbi:MAG: DUF5719 family protein [Nitriliruptoraceae bacterium]
MTRVGIRVTFGVALLVAALVVSADRLVDRGGSPSDEVATTGEADTVLTSGQWTCPMADVGDVETDLRVQVARPDVLEEPGVVEVVEIDGESLISVGRSSVETYGQRSFAPEGVTVVRWGGGPVAVHREWRFTGGDLPPGIVAAGCVAGPSREWVVPGMVTSGGHEAILRLSNPHDTDASVGLQFLTPQGPESPLALQNVSVSARSTVEIVVNESLPERDDLSAIVRVATGRVVVEGMQLVRSAIGGVDGASALQAGGVPREIQTVGWIVDAPQRTSWLWIVNPTDRTANVELTYHLLDGGRIPDGLEELSVPAGSMQRVDLSGTFDDDEVVGVTARSDGVPVVVSAATRIADTAVDRTGFSIQLAAEPSRDWVVAGAGTEDREEQLHLVNPGSASARVDVTVQTGQGPQQPPQLQGLVVGPGSRLAVDLGPWLEDASTWTVFVAADRGIVATRVGGAAVGPRRLVAVPGVSATSWTARGPTLVARRVDGLVARLGTQLGIPPREDQFRFDPVPLHEPDVTEDRAPTRPGTSSLGTVPGDGPTTGSPGQDEGDEEADGVADADGDANGDASDATGN